MSDDSPDMRYILQSRRAPAAVTDCSVGLRAGAGADPGCTVPEHTRHLCCGATGILPVLLQDGPARQTLSPSPSPSPAEPLPSLPEGADAGMKEFLEFLVLLRLQGREIEARRARAWEGHRGHVGCLTQRGGAAKRPHAAHPAAAESPAQPSPGSVLTFNLPWSVILKSLN